MNRTKVDRPDIHLHQCADLTDVIKMDGFEDNAHAPFNPNNADRMKLTWNETRLKSVLQFGLSSYEKMMTKYQKGTGGGPGAPQNFVDWQNRHRSLLPTTLE